MLEMESLVREQWSRVNWLSRAEMKARQGQFQEYQKQYNESHDVRVLWEKMYPLILDAVKSNTCKVNKHNYVIEFDEKVNVAVDLLMTRYVKKPDYNFGSLVTMCYWAVVYANRNEQVMNRDKEMSWEHLVDEMRLHEDEHAYTPDYERLEDIEDYY